MGHGCFLSFITCYRGHNNSTGQQYADNNDSRTPGGYLPYPHPVLQPPKYSFYMTQQQLDDSGGSSVPPPDIYFVTNINYRHVNIQPPIRRTLFRIITLEHLMSVYAGWSLIYRTITDESQSRERSDNLPDPPDVRDLK